MTIFDRVAGISLITPGRLANLRRAAIATSAVRGHVAELGVYRGGSALVLADALPRKTLHLFDTFTGLPFTEDPSFNPTGHDLTAGRFRCSREEAEELVGGPRVVWHEGIFPGSAAGLEDLRFAFVHVDCDLHQSAADAIAWFWPRIKRGGAMFFDDFGCDFIGVTQAVLDAFPESMVQRQTEPGNGIAIGALVVKE